MTNGKPIKPISAAEFSPLDEGGTRQSWKFSPMWIGLGLLVAVAGSVLLFLFTARAVIFNVDPPEALLDIGGLSFNIGDNYLLLPGEHAVTAEAPGYRPLDESIQVSSERNQQIELALEPLPGHLLIESALDNIEVSIDGEPAGIAPGRISDVARGKHLLEFTRHRYFPLQMDVDVEGLDRVQTLQVELLPAWGQMSFNSIPEGASVFIEDENVGTTPLTTEVLQTGTAVRMSLAGFKDWNREVSVQAGTSESYPPVELIVADGRLDVASTPRGANVSVNGEFKGTAPLSVDLPPLRQHRVELFMEGYRKATRSVSLEPEGEDSISVSLSPIIGEIRLRVVPEDAEVLVNGRSQGRGSQTLSLTAREHNLTVRKDGFQQQSQTIVPRPDLDQALDITLLTLQDAYWSSRPPMVTSPVGSRLKLFRPSAGFKLGASRREPGRRANEVERNVRLERPFYIGTHEVTNGQFRRFRGGHSSSAVQGHSLDMDDQPVVHVTWQEAARYANWLSQREGLPPFYTEVNGLITGFNIDSHGYRLPTEAEWAFVARLNNDGVPQTFPWGTEVYPPAEVIENYADVSASRILNLTLANYNDGFAVSAPVGSFSANGRGLFDLGGNVREWVHDIYEIKPTRGEAEIDPTGPAEGSRHTIRGASWSKGARSELRLSARDSGGADGEMDVGFRLARYVDKPGARP